MRGWLWTGFMAVLVASACGSTERRAPTGEPGDAGVTGGDIEVTVENNLQPPIAVTVYLGDQVGTRRTLGDVGPLDTRTFSFRPPTSTGTYRLLARSTSGAELVSDTVTLYAGESVHWRLRGNVLIP